MNYNKPKLHLRFATHTGHRTSLMLKRVERLDAVVFISQASCKKFTSTNILLTCLSYFAAEFQSTPSVYPPPDNPGQPQGI